MITHDHKWHDLTWLDMIPKSMWFCRPGSNAMSRWWARDPCESLVVNLPSQRRSGRRGQLRRYNVMVVSDVWPSKTTRFARKDTGCEKIVKVQTETTLLTFYLMLFDLLWWLLRWWYIQHFFPVVFVDGCANCYFLRWVGITNHWHFFLYLLFNFVYMVLWKLWSSKKCCPSRLFSLLLGGQACWDGGRERWDEGMLLEATGQAFPRGRTFSRPCLATTAAGMACHQSGGWRWVWHKAATTRRPEVGGKE